MQNDLQFRAFSPGPNLRKTELSADYDEIDLDLRDYRKNWEYEIQLASLCIFTQIKTTSKLNQEQILGSSTSRLRCGKSGTDLTT